MTERRAETVVKREDERVLDALVLTAALLAPSDPHSIDLHTPHASSRHIAPSRGMTGRYLDSNVNAIWHGVPHNVRMIWLCIRRHESMSYTGQNPTSSASGAGQWLNGTWDGVKKWVKVNGVFVARQYDEAKDAPAWVQDAAFLHVYKHGGLRMWHGTDCPGT